MKYALLFGGDRVMLGNLPPAESERVMEAVGEWWGRHSHAGRILGGEQLQPPSTATTVRFQGDQTEVVDGPFVDSTEAVGGYGIIDVADLDEALELAKTWPARGFVEIRPIVLR